MRIAYSEADLIDLSSFRSVELMSEPGSLVFNPFRIVSLLSVLGPLALAPPCRAVGTISVTVKSGGSPVVGAWLRAEGLDGRIIDAPGFASGPDGIARIRQVPAARYRVRVAAQDLDPPDPIDLDLQVRVGQIEDRSLRSTHQPLPAAVPDNCAVHARRSYDQEMKGALS